MSYAELGAGLDEEPDSEELHLTDCPVIWAAYMHTVHRQSHPHVLQGRTCLEMAITLTPSCFVAPDFTECFNDVLIIRRGLELQLSEGYCSMPLSTNPVTCTTDYSAPHSFEAVHLQGHYHSKFQPLQRIQFGQSVAKSGLSYCDCIKHFLL